MIGSILLLAGILFSSFMFSVAAYNQALSSSDGVVLGTSISPTITITVSQRPTQPPSPPLAFTPTPTTIKRLPTPTTTPAPSPKRNKPQYNAEQIDETTWKVSNIDSDSAMGSPQDIFNALNSYRGSHGLANLSWDSNLVQLAQSRADLFNKNGTLDSHQGFRDFMDNGGFDKAGFNSLGENSAFLSGPMNGEKIVKNIFGADPLHDENQLDNWSHVGIGINGNAVNVNFGKNKK